ncbi:egg cell-secreted protein 1.3-like [Phragmites australis]|uniref:egg cell-secreted protein 1.3-like n=1 Tax=Phragmites australis TaxID=29695 RepID=UPI002D79A423|nr:egg cell-secreted protein 1.3-like [Phragmites australis]XP_062213468.1 egg cell-secreted protein 1.3-like [Phragmites australis]
MAPPHSMACSRLSLAVLFCLALRAGANAVAGAHLAMFAPAPVPAAPRGRLAELLDGEGSQQCWEALVEIKSCTGEIILFVVNGKAYLGPGCCRAIRVIEQRCWAADAMLSVIGFTREEGDMLKGYCDDGEDDGSGGGQHGSTPPHPAAREIVAPVAGRKHWVHR